MWLVVIIMIVFCLIAEYLKRNVCISWVVGMCGYWISCILQKIFDLSNRTIGMNTVIIFIIVIALIGDWSFLKEMKNKSKVL